MTTTEHLYLEADERTPSIAEAGGMALLRRGLAASPELKVGLTATLMIGLAVAIGGIVVPVTIQRIIDNGVTVTDGEISVDMARVLGIAAFATVVVLIAAVLAMVGQRRLVRATEAALYGLRTRSFAHVHRLSLADHVDNSSGVFLSRVTADIQALARFCQWGLWAWTVGPTVLIGLFVTIAFYSWQLALVVMATIMPTVPIMVWIQRRQLSAHDRLRGSISDLMVESTEAITGAATIRAYGAQDRAERRVSDAATRRYDAGLKRHRFMAVAFSAGDFFGAVSLAAAFGFGVWQREAWGLSSGSLIAVLFLVTLLARPIGELGESADNTQEALAGWRKILDLLDTPIDVVEPEPGLSLPSGALSIQATDVDFAYRDDVQVLHSVSVQIPAGTNVAVVGETGSGKTTFAKLLCRLADPTAGSIEIGGVPLDQAAHAARLGGIRMVPQDGFLFDTTLRENIRIGHAETTDDQISAAVASLGLGAWVAGLEQGLDTEVGSRGGALSVGERQLVALIRAAVADPGLLVLDEATSSVDPETDRALTATIAELSRGRTVVSIAHRLATAEAADLVLVFDQGRIVEAGSHDELVADSVIYSRLHRAWIGNTRTATT